MIQGRDETATDINTPVEEKDVQQLFTQLSANDVEQFYAAFQLTMKRQQMEQLTNEIEQARQRVVDNEAKMLSIALPLIALVSLIELQASGVEDIDLLDRMLERGEEWLDQTMQNLQRCKQLNMLDEGITLWCEHALDGAYDWIASMGEQEGLESSPDQPDDEPVSVTLPSESNTTTEDQLLRKLMSDDDEERVASTTTEQTPPQSEQSEQPEQDETIEKPEAAEILEPEESIPEEELQQAEEQEYDLAIQEATVQETLQDEPVAEALTAMVETTEETAEISTEETESLHHTDEQAEAEAEQEPQEPHNTIAEQPIVLPEEEIRESEIAEEPTNAEEPEAAEEPTNVAEPAVTEAHGETTAEEWPYIYPEIHVVEEEPQLRDEEEQPVGSNQPATVETETPPNRSASTKEAAIQDMDAMDATNTMHTTQSQQTAQPIAAGSGQPQPIQSSHTQAPGNKKQRGRWQRSLARLLRRYILMTQST